MVGSANRQAASQHLDDVRQCGEDFRAFVLRKRKVDATVVEAVLGELRQTPLAGPTELGARVNARLGRQEVPAANLEGALAQISGVPGRRVLRRPLEAGHVQDHEAWLLTAVLESPTLPATSPAGWSVPPVDHGMRRADPTALAARVTPARPLAQGPGALCWRTFLMTLFDGNVPLAVWGRWCGGHKTTILRWIVGLAVAVWPLVYSWIGEQVKAQRVYVDEPWLKIRGRWHYGFVVLDVPTERPGLAALLPSRGPWACRGVGRQLRALNKVPQVLLSDG